MAIRIARLHAAICRHPLRRDRIIVSSAGTHSESTFVTVTVEDADGVRGYGEAATTPIWSGESAATAQWCVNALFVPALQSATFEHPCEALAAMDRLTWGHPFTKGAVDTALWDLWARSQNVAAVTLFADRPPVPAIPSRISIGAYDVAKTVALALTFHGLGIRTLKFKVGLAGVDDAARLRGVRAALGDEPVFTVDYNGAFRSADEAAAHIESLRPFGVAWFEQPTHRDRLRALAEVRRLTGAPILADEAVFTPDHLAEALDMNAMDAVAIYPGKNGGFTRALDMAHTCQRAGVPCVIGSNLETDLGQAAMAALAAGCTAFAVDHLAGDLASSLYYRQASATPPLRLAEGHLHLPEGPGFGVEPVEPTRQRKHQ